MSKTESNSQRSIEKEWLDVRGLTNYADVSERTVRDWIHRPNNPLPAVQVLVKRSVFDDWLTAHPVQSSQGVDLIVNDLMKGILG